MRNISEVRERMFELVGRADGLGFINARLIIRTGIGLNDPVDAVTPADLARVIASLKDMGFELDGHRGRSRAVAAKRL